MIPKPFVIMDEISTFPPEMWKKLEEKYTECDVCGNRTFGVRCKIECPNCGARRDCSDP